MIFLKGTPLELLRMVVTVQNSDHKFEFELSKVLELNPCQELASCFNIGSRNAMNDSILDNTFDAVTEQSHFEHFC